MWGEHRRGGWPVPSWRTIPTRVGRTKLALSQGERHSDHPHACGENSPALQPTTILTGPSPRVWGEPARVVDHVPLHRTIPTRVGRTSQVRVLEHPVPDHPHACGENSSASMMRDCACGPSPRVWGERMTLPTPPHHVRTIPTRVGRTKPSAPPPSAHPDHPHACGENIPQALSFPVEHGPSPRVWGEH